MCWRLASLRQRGKLSWAAWPPPHRPPLLPPAPGPSPRAGHWATGPLEGSSGRQLDTNLPTSQDQPRGHMGQRVAALSLSFYQNLQKRLRFAS